MTETVRAVFFDLDDTLIHDGAGEAVRLTAAGIAPRIGLSAEAVLAANLEAWSACWAEQGDRWMRGELPGDALPRDIWRRTLAVLGVTDDEVLDDAVTRHLAAELRESRLFDETVEVLRGLREGGISLGLITNGPSDSQRAKLAETGIDSFFDVVVASGDIGVLKPDAAIFRHALERMDVEATEALHVGDNFTADVVGAVGAGLSAAWVNREHAVAPDPGVRHHDCQSLRDVLALTGMGRRGRPG